MARRRAVWLAPLWMSLMVVAQEPYDYPHSQSYKRYVWEEFNIGTAKELDIKFDVPVGAKATAYAAKHKPDHSFPEPAHVKLCRALINPPVPPKEGKTKRVVIVEEDDHVCQGTLKGGSSFTALIRMYAAALVAHAAHVLGRYDIFYQHGCGSRLSSKYANKRKWAEKGTIQQFLPPFLKVRMDENAEKSITPLIKNNCGRCVAEFEEAKKTGFVTYDPFPSCLYFPSMPFPVQDLKGVTHNEVSMTEAVRRQLQAVEAVPVPKKEPMVEGVDSPPPPAQEKQGWQIRQEERARQKETPAPIILTEEQKVQRQTMLEPYALVVRSLLQTLRYTMREATAEVSAVARDEDDFLFKTLSVLNVDGAVIYLDCAATAVSDDAQKVLSIPYYMYASELSQGVSRIAIITSGRCQKKVPLLEHYALGLKEFMSNVFEEATVSLAYMDSHSAVAYAHMYLAKQLIAPPSESVILPMLANRKFKTIIQSEELYPWMPILVDIMKTQRTGKGFEDHVHFLEAPIYPLHKGVQWGDTLKNLMRIESKGPDLEGAAYIANQCQRVRGRWGKWVQDYQYAKLAQYVTPVKGYTGMADAVFKPTKEEPYRKPTTYKWVDAFESSCHVELMTREGFCQTMKNLHLQRIMFVGDSLTFHWSQSFWKLLGHSDTPVSGTQVGVNEGYHWEEDIVCSDDHKIKALYIRSDNLDIHTKGRESCGDHSGTCFEWETKYSEDRTPTLLLANTGSHTSFDENFRNDFNEFFIHLDELNRNEDVVFFRTSVPGHRECLLDDLTPYSNYTQYVQTLDDSYNPYAGTDLPNINAYKAFHWDHFTPYNKYVHNLLDTRAAHLEKHPGAMENQIDIEVLDVMPMTILRPDGHASSPDCQGCGLRKGNIGDCLHYSLPGPIDWWNHLMYSQLTDVMHKKAARKKEG